MKNLIAILLVLAITSCLAAQDSFTPIRFEFDGPDVPSDWRLGAFPGGSRTISEDSFVITPPDNAGASSVYDFEHRDLYVETQIRFLEERSRVDWASITIRDPLDDNLEGYFGAVSSNGDLLMARILPGVGVDTSLQVTASGFDAFNDDLKMRLVANGSSLELFAWPATDTLMPPSPQLTLNDDRFMEGSYVALGNTSFRPVGEASPIAFRYVEIVPVPEPSTAATGIFGILMLLLGARRWSSKRSLLTE